MKKSKSSSCKKLEASDVGEISVYLGAATQERTVFICTLK